MHFTRSILLALSAVAAVVAQDKQNPFLFANGPDSYNTKAGASLELTWKPTSPGSVTLVLRKGAASNLSPGTIIKANIPNNGKYTWQVPNDIVQGSDYAIEIVDDTNPAPENDNYTNPLTIDSDVKSAASSQLSSIALPTVTGSMTSGTASMTMTGSSSSMATDSSSMASSSGSASSSAKASHASASTSPSGNAAPRATAMAGLLGVAALAAAAL